jgi:hypothetical protein
MACLICNVFFHVRSVRRRTRGNRTEELKEIMRLKYGENTVEPEKKVLQAWWYSCLEMSRQRSTSLEKN